MLFRFPLGIVLLAGSCSAGTVCALKSDAAGGVKNETSAFQAAIDECAAHGGGTVPVGPGSHRIGPIALKSNVTLELPAGAELKASTDFNDYPITGENIWQGEPQKRPVALIHAEHQSHIAITGKGVIDGGGSAWWKPYRERKRATGEEMPRPWMVQFSYCDHVLVEGVTLQNSPSYTLVPYFSTDVTVRGIKILAPPDSPNTDGVAPYSSHRVRISDATIDTGDDNVAIKSSRSTDPGLDSSCSDVTVSNSTFLHGHGATIGADTGGGVHNVVMEHVRLEGTQYGLRIKSGRGFAGEVDHITYRDIVMTAADPAVSVTEYYPNVPKQDAGQPLSPTTPRFHDITLERVKAEGGKSAGIVVGLPETPIANFVMRDVEISAGQGLTVRNAAVVLRESHIRPQSGPAIIREQNAQVDEGEPNKEKSSAR
jgi:polygalacturonase